MFLNLDGKLLHVLVVLDVFCNRLLDDLGSLFAVLLGPLNKELLVALLCLLLYLLSEVAHESWCIGLT